MWVLRPWQPRNLEEGGEIQMEQKQEQVEVVGEVMGFLGKEGVDSIKEQGWLEGGVMMKMMILMMQLKMMFLRLAVSVVSKGWNIYKEVGLDSQEINSFFVLKSLRGPPQVMMLLMLQWKEYKEVVEVWHIISHVHVLIWYFLPVTYILVLHYVSYTWGVTPSRSWSLIHLLDSLEATLPFPTQTDRIQPCLPRDWGHLAVILVEKHLRLTSPCHTENKIFY